jgi:hypothetical protein
MSNDRPTVIPVQGTRRRPRGAAFPCSRRPGPDAAAGRDVIRVDMGLSEWALVLALPRAASSPVAPPPGGLAGMLARLPASRLGVVRVPGLADTCLGLAVLHYLNGKAVIYCTASQVTDFAAGVLSALAEQVMYGLAQPGTRITVTQAGHFELLAEEEGRHPAKVEIAGDEVTFSVCSDSITAELALALGLLWTAQAAYLPRPGLSQPGARGAGPARARSLMPGGSTCHRARLPARPARRHESQADDAVPGRLGQDVLEGIRVQDVDLDRVRPGPGVLLIPGVAAGEAVAAL